MKIATSEMRTLRVRRHIEVNTDPQRRCYNGCHFSSEWKWTPWEVLGRYTVDMVEEKLRYWRELNDYAISQRGESARSEFEIVPDELAP